MNGRRGGSWRLPGLALAGCVASCLAALPARAQQEGNAFTNLFKYGGTTVPPSQPKELEAAYCPSIDVAEGGAALRTVAGTAVRSQVSLGRLARECARRLDGSITVKVGVEARVLLGPGGAPGRFDVPVTVLIKHEGKVIVSRIERSTAVIEPGEAQGFASIVVDGLTVPPALSADYDIEVSLGAKGAGKGAAKAGPANSRRKKPAVAAAPDGGGDAAQ